MAHKQSVMQKLLAIVIAAGAVAFSGVAWAARATDYEKRADGLAVYMGVLPAEVLRGRAETNHVTTMHDGSPEASGSHHVVISIFDERTQRQIADATVEASVGSRVRAGTRRVLEPMKIRDTMTYGNFFPLPGPGPFVVRVEIRRPGQDQPTRVQFNYAHP